MADSDDEHDQPVKLDPIHDAVIADADAPDVVGATQFDGTCHRIGR